MFDGAWNRAGVRYAASPRWTRREAAAEAGKRARLVRELVANTDVNLTAVERMVLQYAADVADAVGSTAVNLPQRRTAEKVGYGEKAVRLGLDRLLRSDLLRIGQLGRKAADPANRRATSYVLPSAKEVSAYLGRETRQVRPSASTDTPHGMAVSAPLPLTDTPRHDAPGSVLVTGDPEALTRALALLESEGCSVRASHGSTVFTIGCQKGKGESCAATT